MTLAPDNLPSQGEHTLFLQQLDLIEKTIRAVCREKQLAREEAEDFAQSVRLKLLEDDGAVLRKYRGRRRYQRICARSSCAIFSTCATRSGANGAPRRKSCAWAPTRSGSRNSWCATDRPWKRQCRPC